MICNAKNEPTQLDDKTGEYLMLVKIRDSFMKKFFSVTKIFMLINW
jgi:hypothetical protein